MVNTYTKGNRTQQKAKRWCEAIGYQVEVIRRDKWRKDQDFFGLWDLICVGHNLLFVQVKTNAMPPKEWMDKAKAWKAPHGTAKLLVVYKDYQRGEIPSKIVVLDNDS